MIDEILSFFRIFHKALRKTLYFQSKKIDSLLIIWFYNFFCRIECVISAVILSALDHCPLESTRVLTGLMYRDIEKRKNGENEKEIN